MGILLLVVFLFSGCKPNLVLTEAESGQIAEYLSYLILKNSRYYDDNLISGTQTQEPEVTIGLEPTKPPVQPVSGEEAMETVSPSDKKETKVTFSDLISIKGVDIFYKGYDVTDEIQNEYFSVEAPIGQKILLLTFTIKNSTKKEQVMDLINSGIEYHLLPEGKNNIKPMLTFTPNVLQYTKFMIPPKGSVEGVLLFAIDFSMKSVKTNLEISKGDQRFSISVN